MYTINGIEVDDFTRHYVACALWASTDDNGDPLDDNYDETDLAPETIRRMVEDCADFRAYRRKENGPAIADLLNAIPHTTDEQHGHDFWLTRNRHGAGFWDRGYPKPDSTILTNAAYSYGEQNLYVGNDGKLYVA